MPEAEKSSTKGAKRPKDDVADDAIGRAAEIVRGYQNHIVIATCLVILGVFGWRWWSGQKAVRESWGWQGLREEATVDQLQKSVAAYADTAAAPYLKLRLAKLLHEEGKLEEAKTLYTEIGALGKDHLAAQLAGERLRELRADEDFLKILPSKLQELAKNAPSALPIELNLERGQQEEFGPPRDLMPPADPPG